MKNIFCLATAIAFFSACTDNYIRLVNYSKMENDKDMSIGISANTLHRKMPKVHVSDAENKPFLLSSFLRTKSLIVVETQKEMPKLDSSLADLNIQLEEYKIAQKTLNSILLIVVKPTTKASDKEKIASQYLKSFTKVLFISQEEASKLNVVSDMQNRYIFSTEGIALSFSFGKIDTDSLEIELSKHFGIAKNIIIPVDYKARDKEFLIRNNYGITESKSMEFGKSITSLGKQSTENKYLPNFQVTDTNNRKIYVYNLIKTRSYIITAIAHCGMHTAILTVDFPPVIEKIKAKNPDTKFYMFYILDEIALAEPEYVKKHIEELLTPNKNIELYFIDKADAEKINISFLSKYLVNKNKKVEAVILARDFSEEISR